MCGVEKGTGSELRDVVLLGSEGALVLVCISGFT